MKTLMFYCQHVLGIGHLIRSLSLVEELKNTFEIVFLNGGVRLADIAFPSGITVVDLPPIQSDGEFEMLPASGQSQPLKDIQEVRRSMILEEWDRLRPDIFLIELFPFGRKQFAAELVPVLARNRLANSPSKIVCSVRDILVSKSDQARHEEWVCHLINRYFNLVLVHSDPTFQTLNETFGPVSDLQCDVAYTGFVTQHNDATSTKFEMNPMLEPKDSPIIVVSIGGGRVGYELLECSIQAGILLQKTLPHRMLIFSGPNLPDFQFSQLQAMLHGQSGLILRRYTDHFLSYLQNADLSISMAGYNTCMNIVTSGIQALVRPFTGHENDEQSVRAQKLEQRGVLSIIGEDELHPETLSKKISHILLDTDKHSSALLDTNGAEKSVQIIQALTEIPPSSLLLHDFASPKVTNPLWVETLREALDHIQNTHREIQLFLRDDDGDEDIEPLRQLLDVSLSRQVPLTLAIIPGTLNHSAVRLFHHHKRAASSLLEIHQHGWMHLNHEKEGRKCEFGPSRSYEEQREDIAKGKAILEQTFSSRFFPAFTPPWNRCTAETFKALDELGFQVLSKDVGKEFISGYQFREISTTLDLYHWKSGATMKEPTAIVNTFIDQIQNSHPIGLLLHHKVMDGQAFAFLDRFLEELCRSSIIRFNTLQSLSTLTEKAIR